MDFVGDGFILPYCFFRSEKSKRLQYAPSTKRGFLAWCFQVNLVAKPLRFHGFSIVAANFNSPVVTGFVELNLLRDC